MDVFGNSEGIMPDGATRMPVVHQHGPCSSPLADENGKVMPSHEDILSADQRRVQSIHRRASMEAGGSFNRTSTSQPSSSGSVLETGYYVVPIGLGTPTERYTVVLDTGSDVTWVQCLPCTGHLQKEPVFSPANSSTYANISCWSPYCSDLDTKFCKPGHVCAFSVDYVDNSHTSGTYGRDTLSLGADTIKGFRFGCSHYNIRGHFGQSAGVLGLGRGNTSLMVQAQSKYGGVFSYCLPADQTGTGFLDFGPGAAATAANARLTTPMLVDKGPRYYYVGMTGIKVGGHMLPIDGSVFSTAGTIMDSGTVITRLPPSAYGPLRKAFAHDMEALGYKRGHGYSFLDTCFNLTGHQGVIALPTVSLVFQGGASLDLDASGILYVPAVSHACLAFAANFWDTDVAVIGSTQHKTYAVSYDLGNKVVGFTPGAC
ncbi:unnamed protein product [Urochloa humidicola]